MSNNQTSSPEEVASQRDAFIERFLQSVSGTFSLFSIYIGDRLGLYRALAEGGPATPAELASRTGTYERYIREWLEQQTVTNILQVENENEGSHSRRYSLPAGHVEPLTDCSSLNYVVPMAQLLVGAVRPLPAILDAYRNGGGVPFDDYGSDLREGQAAVNYPAFWNQLPDEWLPAIPDVHARLQADPPARVADIGCGYGWSSMGMARGYPKIHVDGFDLDLPSIARAQENARRNGLTERVHFQVRDAGDSSLAGQYDLVTVFEALHDMNNPVGALQTMRRLAKQDGTVLVVDERVGDTFTAQGDDVERMMYGWSITHCLPASLADQPSAAIGTVIREGTVRELAAEGCFGRTDVLDVDGGFFRLYAVHP